jgi:hypothetical protein
MSSKKMSIGKMASSFLDSKDAKSAFKIVSNPDSVVGWAVRVVVLLLAALVVPKLPESVLVVLENTFVRLVVLLAVLGLSFWDPSTAILLAIAFVVGIQTLNKYKVANIANSNILGAVESYENEEPTCQGLQGKIGDVTTPLGVCCSNKTDVKSYDPACHESFYNFSDNSVTTEYVAEANDSAFTSEQQFVSAQTNVVDNNQETEVKTWENELGPQGLSQPQGYGGDQLFEL